MLHNKETKLHNKDTMLHFKESVLHYKETMLHNKEIMPVAWRARHQGNHDTQQGDRVTHQLECSTQ